MAKVKKVVLISGHTTVTSMDNGAQGFIDEGKANAIARNAMASYLIGYPIRVFCDPKDMALSDEIKFVNGCKADFTVALHNNAGGGDGWEGLMSINGSTKKFLEICEKRIKKMGQNSRGIKTRRQKDGRDYYGFIRQTNCPACIMETVFVDNKKDVKFQDTATEMRLVGYEYAKALLEYFGIKDNGYQNDNDVVAYIALGTRKLQKEPNAKSEVVGTMKAGKVFVVDPDDNVKVDKGEYIQHWRKVGKDRWICVKGKDRYADNLE